MRSAQVNATHKYQQPAAVRGKLLRAICWLAEAMAVHTMPVVLQSGLLSKHQAAAIDFQPKKQLLLCLCWLCPHIQQINLWVT